MADDIGISGGKGDPSRVRPLGVSVSQAPNYVPFGKTSIYKLIKAGRLQTVLVGRRRIILWSSLEALLDPAQPEAK